MSVTKERQETFYAKPMIKRLLDGYSKSESISKSSIVNEALKERFAKLSDRERERLIKISSEK